MACVGCERKVYKMDKDITFEGGLYHLACFRCSKCKKTLNEKTGKAKDGQLYCNFHFKKAFPVKKDAPQKTPERRAVDSPKSKDLEQAAADAALALTAAAASSPKSKRVKCTICNRKVFSTDVTVDGKPYHEKCMLCTKCSKRLKATNVLFGDDGKMYCPFHHKRLFGTPKKEDGGEIPPSSPVSCAFATVNGSEDQPKREGPGETNGATIIVNGVGPSVRDAGVKGKDKQTVDALERRRKEEVAKELTEQERRRGAQESKLDGKQGHREEEARKLEDTTEAERSDQEKMRKEGKAQVQKETERDKRQDEADQEKKNEKEQDRKAREEIERKEKEEIKKKKREQERKEKEEEERRKNEEEERRLEREKKRAEERKRREEERKRQEEELKKREEEARKLEEETRKKKEEEKRKKEEEEKKKRETDERKKEEEREKEEARKKLEEERIRVEEERKAKEEQKKAQRKALEQKEVEAQERRRRMAEDEQKRQAKDEREMEELKKEDRERQAEVAEKEEVDRREGEEQERREAVKEPMCKKIKEKVEGVAEAKGKVEKQQNVEVDDEDQEATAGDSGASKEKGKDTLSSSKDSVSLSSSKDDVDSRKEKPLRKGTTQRSGVREDEGKGDGGQVSFTHLLKKKKGLPKNASDKSKEEAQGGGQVSFTHMLKKTKKPGERMTPERAASEPVQVSFTNQLKKKAAVIIFCKQCDNKVEAEDHKLEIKRRVYHKRCFFCAKCDSILVEGQYTQDAAGKINCGKHFAKLSENQKAYDRHCEEESAKADAKAAEEKARKEREESERQAAIAKANAEAKADADYVSKRTKEQIQEDVVELVKALFVAFKSRTVEDITAFFEDRASLFSVDHMVNEGPPALSSLTSLSYAEQLCADRKVYEQVLDEGVQVQLSECTAMVWAPYKRSSDSVPICEGVCVFTLQRTAGNWKICQGTDTRQTPTKKKRRLRVA